MIRKILLLALLFPAFVFADTRFRELNETSVIEDSVCIPELSGEGFLHIDEDVSGLIIEVVGKDGTSIARYDVGTEIEDIATIGTYAAPTASNVRVSPDLLAGDCTQMMFADAVYANEDWVEIRITDGQVTIMDFTRWVFLNTLTGRMTGLKVFTDIASVTSQTIFVLTDGPTNDDAYPAGSSVSIKGATEECEADVLDYTGASKTLTILVACPFTVAANDLVWVRSGASAPSSKELVALTAASIDSIWDEIVEDTGATYTARCLLATVLSYTAGQWTQAGAVITYQDPGGNENRIVGTIQSPGFDTITITCP